MVTLPSEASGDYGLVRRLVVSDMDIARINCAHDGPAEWTAMPGHWGERAECVMLNKGPHSTEAMRTLDDILRRMQSHQTKKRSLLRALRAWSLPHEPER